MEPGLRGGDSPCGLVHHRRPLHLWSVWMEEGLAGGEPQTRSGRVCQPASSCTSVQTSPQLTGSDKDPGGVGRPTAPPLRMRFPGKLVRGAACPPRKKSEPSTRAPLCRLSRKDPRGFPGSLRTPDHQPPPSASGPLRLPIPSCLPTSHTWVLNTNTRSQMSVASSAAFLNPSTVAPQSLSCTSLSHPETAL